MNDFECPYCKHGHNYTGDGIGDGDYEEIVCDSCGKEFIISCSVILHFTAYCANSSHSWELVDAHGIQCRECTACGLFEIITPIFPGGN